MTLDLTKPVQTRDGRKVRILCTDMDGEYDSIVGIVMNTNESEQCESWRPDGHYYDTSETNSDLVNVPETRVVWVNMYPGNFHTLWPAKERADAMQKSDNSREACIRVEYEVGQFDE